VNYFEDHIGDYAAATTHLSWDEDMAYTRLIRAYYHSERPIPKAQAYRLARAASASQRKAVDAVLLEFFELRGDAYHQKRCDEEIARFHDKQNKAKRSADARWSAQRTQSDRNAKAMRTHSEGNAPSLQSPDTNSEPKGSGGRPPKSEMSPDEILFGYGVPYLVETGSAEKHARSFIGKLRKLHGDAAVIEKLRACLKLRPSQPVEWLAAALPPENAPPKVEWHETQSGIEEMGESLGIGRWDEEGWKSRGFMQSESFNAYKATVIAAHQRRAA
jgi:uncharacterized protein YdaU (DUF1376 family)